MRFFCSYPNTGRVNPSMKLTHLTSTALLALVTTIGLQAGSTNDMKDM